MLDRVATWEMGPLVYLRYTWTQDGSGWNWGAQIKGVRFCPHANFIRWMSSNSCNTETRLNNHVMFVSLERKNCNQVKIKLLQSPTAITVAFVGTAMMDRSDKHTEYGEKTMAVGRFVPSYLIQLISISHFSSIKMTHSTTHMRLSVCVHWSSGNEHRK